MQDKFSKKDALDMLEEAGSHAAAALCLLESMADRTFSDLSREDLSILLKKEDNLRVKLNKLDREVKTKKFRYKIKKNPNLLDVTFCKKADYSFLDSLPIKNDEDNKQCEDEEGKDIMREESLYVEFLSESNDEIETEKTIFQKKLNDIQDKKYLMERTKSCFQNIVAEAELQGTSVTQLLALLMYRANYNLNHKLALEMKKLFDGEEVSTKVDLELALHLTERLKLGKGRYRHMRMLLRPHASFPDYSAVFSLWRSFCPTILLYSNEGQVVGVFVHLEAALQSHIQRLVKSASFQLEEVNCSLAVNVTIGIDSRGDEKEYLQKSQVSIDTTHSTSILY